MAAPDARTRNKVTLNPHRVRSSSIPTDLIPQIFLSNLLFALALHAGKEWLLKFDVGIFWVTLRVLAFGGLVVLIKEGFTGELMKKKSIEWTVLGMSSLLLLVQQVSLFTLLYRLPATRAVLFTHFSSIWTKSIIEPATARKTITVLLSLVLSFVSDISAVDGDFRVVLPAYIALVTHALSSSGLEHTQGVLSPALGSTFTTAASTLGACLLFLPLYMFREVLLHFPTTPVLPLSSLAALPLLSYTLLFLSPNTSRSHNNVSYSPRSFMVSYPSAFVFACIIGIVAFGLYPSFTDIAVGGLLFYGMYPVSLSSLTVPTRTPTARLIRSYIKTILSNPESRKIFYFLMLNLSYMGVQMLYGVWTNSLGLISDAIHMAFDCMAIGMGLFASVMATWEPNERFTYGYGRIETLSGFANGIFLILISIFIVFEAIQRILEPPEMNTSQLLLVSSLGLGVNLFGMFAMGGHHHGGHSHSHGHSHAHTDDHAHSGHSHGGHDGHSHSNPLLTSTSDAHSHSSSHTTFESHSHSHVPQGINTHPRPLSHSPTSSPTNINSPQAHQCHHEPSNSHSPAPLSASLQSRAHSHSHSPTDPTHNHSHNHDHSHSHESEHYIDIGEDNDPPDASGRSKHSRGPSLEIPMHRNAEVGSSNLEAPSNISPDGVFSPLTPSYKFGHDEHYDAHHLSDHAPNLHAPDLHKPHVHEGHSHNMRGVFLHVMADTLGSVGVIISTLLIQFYGWTGFDPIASLFIAILIAASVIPLVIDTGKILCLDVDHRETDIQQALSELPFVEGLASYTSPRFWPKDASSLIGSIHIQLTASSSSHDPTGPHSTVRATYTHIDRVVERVDTLLRSKISGLEELTIQIEGTNDSTGR